MIRLLEDWTITLVDISIPAMLINPVQEGEDYGKGVIFYLRENKVMNGPGGWGVKHLLHWKVKSYTSTGSVGTYKPTCYIGQMNPQC